VLIACDPKPPKTVIPLAEWSEVQARYAAGESLRTLAASYDVSHEAIRSIIRRAA
jgi:Mor family transcriptional regulator